MNTNTFDNRTRSELIVELEDLRASEEKYRILLDESSDPIFTFSPDGQYRYVNREFAHGLGKAPEEIIGRNIWDVFPQEEADKRFAIVKWVFENGESKIIEVRVPRPDGDRYYITTAKPILDDRRRVISVICISKEITERKRIEAELIAAKQAAETANLAKSRFLAAASHDLRQPIQAIGLFNDALIRTGLSAEQERISDYLSRSAQSLGDLLSALLDISRLDAGVVKPSLEVIQVETLFNKIDADLSPLAFEKSLRFKLCFPFRTMSIVADGKLLASLLGNLIGNAIKYTERGGILVGIRRRGGRAAIQVWDTGIGVAPEHMNNIFEEYFQVGNPERDKTKGLGLGLAIAQRLANLLETEVVCRSRLGKGTVFEFHLPLTDESPRENRNWIEQETPAAGAVSDPGGRHIVVVEDDVMVSKSIELSLGSLGMRVTTYGNAEEALANSEITDADFYITDFRLLGLNGVQFLDALQQRSTQPIKAVILTGDTSPDRIEITQSSRWPILFKPVDLPKLLAEIE